MANKQTDVYHITVAGMNPHDVASCIGDPASPFYDKVGRPGVAQHYGEQGLEGGIVEVWAGEHLTPAQEASLKACGHVVDVRHVYP